MKSNWLGWLWNNNDIGIIEKPVFQNKYRFQDRIFQGLTAISEFRDSNEHSVEIHEQSIAMIVDLHKEIAEEIAYGQPCDDDVFDLIIRRIKLYEEFIEAAKQDEIIKAFRIWWLDALKYWVSNHDMNLMYDMQAQYFQHKELIPPMEDALCHTIIFMMKEWHQNVDSQKMSGL